MPVTLCSLDRKQTRTLKTKTGSLRNVQNGAEKQQSELLSSWDLPDAQKFGLLARRRRLRLHLQRVDVGDGDDGGGHVPRKAHERADHHEDGHPEEVQVVACAFLKSGRIKHNLGTPALKNDLVVAL